MIIFDLIYIIMISIRWPDDDDLSSGSGVKERQSESVFNPPIEQYCHLVV